MTRQDNDNNNNNNNDQQQDQNNNVGNESPNKKQQGQWSKIKQKLGLTESIEQVAEEEARRLKNASEVLLERLFSYLSKLPEEDSTEQSTSGITLPASAVGWLSSQLYPPTPVDNNNDDNDDDASLLYGNEYHEETLWMGVSIRDRLLLLKFLLPRATHVRITCNQTWPPPLPPPANPVSSSSSPTPRQLRRRQQDVPFDLSCSSTISVSSAITTESSRPRPTMASFLKFVEKLKNNPRIDFRVFPKARVVVLDHIPSAWIYNLSCLQPTLRVLRIERGCIHNVSQLLLSSKKNKKKSDNNNTNNNNNNNNDHHDPLSQQQVQIMSFQSQYPKLSHLRLSHCDIGELSGLRANPAPLTMCPNLVSLSLSHNQIVSQKCALAGLKQLVYLNKLDLSFNLLTSLDQIFHRVGRIQILVLTGNKLTSTRGIERLYALQELWLDDNNIESISDIAGLARLPELNRLYLRGNPIEAKQTSKKKRNYRLNVLELFQEQRRLDNIADLKTFLPILDGVMPSARELQILDQDLNFRSEPIRVISVHNNNSMPACSNEQTPSGSLTRINSNTTTLTNNNNQNGRLSTTTNVTGAAVTTTIVEITPALAHRRHDRVKRQRKTHKARIVDDNDNKNNNNKNKLVAAKKKTKSQKVSKNKLPQKVQVSFSARDVLSTLPATIPIKKITPNYLQQYQYEEDMTNAIGDPLQPNMENNNILIDDGPVLDMTNIIGKLDLDIATNDTLQSNECDDGVNNKITNPFEETVDDDTNNNDKVVSNVSIQNQIEGTVSQLVPPDEKKCESDIEVEKEQDIVAKQPSAEAVGDEANSTILTLEKTGSNNITDTNESFIVENIESTNNSTSENEKVSLDREGTKTEPTVVASNSAEANNSESSLVPNDSADTSLEIPKSNTNDTDLTNTTTNPEGTANVPDEGKPRESDKNFDKLPSASMTKNNNVKRRGPRLAKVKLVKTQTVKQAFNVFDEDWDSLIEKAKAGLIPDGKKEVPILLEEPSATNVDAFGHDVFDSAKDVVIDANISNPPSIDGTTTNYDKSAETSLADTASQYNTGSFPRYIGRDDVSVTSSLDTNREDYAKLNKFQIAENNSQFDGPEPFRETKISDNIELYFEIFVFHDMTTELPESVLEELLEEDDWQAVPLLYPRIQLCPTDRRLVEAKLLYSEESKPISTLIAQREQFVRLWEEDVLACGKAALRRLLPMQAPRMGFHGESQWVNGNPDMYIASRKVYICLSSSAFYIIVRDDKISNQIKEQKKRFPLPLPNDATFNDARWPHAVARHELKDLQGISIGFGFQRLTLRFTNTMLPNISEPFTYVLHTCNKMRTVSLLKDFESQKTNTAIDTDIIVPTVVDTMSVKIENDDRTFLDALAAAVAPAPVGVVLHYQIVQQKWKSGNRDNVRRVCILTDSKIYLMDEDYLGDGSVSGPIPTPTANHHNDGNKLGDVHYRLVDDATLGQITEVQAASADPTAITIIIRPLTAMSRSHRWRLVCRDSSGAEKLVEDVRKAISMADCEG